MNTNIHSFVLLILKWDFNSLLLRNGDDLWEHRNLDWKQILLGDSLVTPVGIHINIWRTRFKKQSILHYPITVSIPASCRAKSLRCSTLSVSMRLTQHKCWPASKSACWWQRSASETARTWTSWVTCLRCSYLVVVLTWVCSAAIAANFCIFKHSIHRYYQQNQRVDYVVSAVQKHKWDSEDVNVYSDMCKV